MPFLKVNTMLPSTFTIALFHQRIERRMEFPLDAPPASVSLLWFPAARSAFLLRYLVPVPCFALDFFFVQCYNLSDMVLRLLSNVSCCNSFPPVA